MKAAFIIIGNELLSGKITDINTQFAAQNLFKRGIELKKVAIVEDSEESFIKTLDQLVKEVDVIFISGGLGPTEDDLTKPMIAKYFNLKISPNEKVKELVLTHFKRGNREYDESIINYHHFPNDCKALKNPIGFAPGIFYVYKNVKIFALPGVPREFSSMFEIVCSEFLTDSKLFLKNVVIKTWKTAELKIFKELCPNLWQDLSKFGSVSSLPNPLGVDIGVMLMEKDLKTLKNKEKKIIELISNTPLKDNIWHIGEKSLEEIIVNEAKEKNLKLGFAESCTAGLCASRLTDISGASSVFWGSIVSYANEVKINQLNVKESTLNSVGAVSQETALEMAIGAKESLNVDIAVSTTGIAGPLGGSKDKPVGTIGIGIASKKNKSSKIYHFHGNRKSLKDRFSHMALMLLLQEIRQS